MTYEDKVKIAYENYISNSLPTIKDKGKNILFKNKWGVETDDKNFPLRYFTEEEFTNELITDPSLRGKFLIITVEELIEQYDNLQFFDEELKMKDKDNLYRAYHEPELLGPLTMEMIFVNKLTTISRYNNWKAQKESMSQHHLVNIFKERITNPETPADNFGHIKGFGMKMSIEEFDVFEKAHEEIFIMDNIDEQ